MTISINNMNFFIIQVPESKFSISHAEKAYKSVKKFYDNVEIYNGYDPLRAAKYLNDNSISYRRIHKDIHEWSLEKAKRPGMLGSFASHYSLWELCLKLDETICILEHDARMFSPIIHENFEDGIMQIDIEDSKPPTRLYYQPNYKYDIKTSIKECYYVKNNIPLALGLAAYLIKPKEAKFLVDLKAYGPPDHIVNGYFFKIYRQIPPSVYTINDGKSFTRNYEQDAF